MCISWVHPQAGSGVPLGAWGDVPTEEQVQMETLSLATSAWRQGWEAELSAAAMPQPCDLGTSPPWPGSTAVAQAQGPLSVTRSLQGHCDGGQGSRGCGAAAPVSALQAAAQGRLRHLDLCLRKQPVSGGKPGHHTPGKLPRARSRTWHRRQGARVATIVGTA